MVYELMDRLVLGKKYQLQEIYDLIEDYCVVNCPLCQGHFELV